MKFLLSGVLLISAACYAIAQGSRAFMEQAKKFESDQNSEKAIEAYRKAATHAVNEGNWGTAQSALIKSAAHGIFLGQSGEARKELDEAFSIERKFHPGDSSQLALGYHYYGQYFHYFSYYADSARYFYTKSLRMWEMVRDTTEIARNLVMLGDIERYYFYDYARAERYFEQALPLLLSLKKRDYWLASTYYNLGTTYRSKGDFEKALANTLEAIKIVDEIDDPLLREGCLSSISHIYFNRGEFDLAIENFRQTITWNIRNNGSASNRALSYINIGLCFQQKGQHDEALKNFDVAAIQMKQDHEDNTSRIAELLMNRAKSLIAKRKYGEAAKCYFSARNIYRSQGRMNTKLASTLFFEMGDFYKTQLKSDSALWYYHQSMMMPLTGRYDSHVESLPAASAFGYRYYLFEPLLSKAEIFMAAFRKDKKQHSDILKTAIRHLTMAEELLQSHRNSYDYQASKARLSEKYHSLYELFVEAAFDANELKMAGADTLLLNILENSKAKQLQENLQDVSAASSIGLPDSILFRQHSIISSQILFNEKMSEEISKKEPDTTKVKYYQENLIALDIQSLELKKKLQSEYPMFYAVKVVRRSPSLSEVLKVAREKHIVFFDYFWGTGTVYCMVIDASGMLIKKIGSADSLRNVIRKLMTNVVHSDQPLTSSVRFNEFRELSSDLYDRLVPAGVISGASIVIVPDGDLYQMPFEMLLTSPATGSSVNYKGLPYLVKQTRLGYAYSLSAYLREIPDAKVSPSLVGFAYSGEDVNKEIVSRDKLSDALPGTEKELSAMKSVLGYGDFFYEQRATEAQFKQSAPSFDILHLALHGQSGSNPLDAKLLFRHGLKNEEDDTLFTNEIYAIKLKAMLAVLTACETGTGRVDKGEGVSSVASAFAYAGCPRVVMSLWKVDDGSVAGLMDLFYRQLSDGANLSDALAETKVRYIEGADELSAHPSFWAPFVLMGNEKAIFRKRKYAALYSISAVLASVLIAFFVYKKRRTV